MELYDLCLRLNQTVHQQFRIKAKNNGFMIAVYVNENVHCYVSLIEGQKKEVTFTDPTVRYLEHENDEYIYRKIISTLPTTPKL
uniref:Uncharacterized protein n=1 Tax=viral metagenome TaxID=1070528 RepID=A0A6C0C775_9ZZZZ